MSHVSQGHPRWTGHSGEFWPNIAESEEELESLLMKVKKENENVGLNLKKLRSWHPVPSLHGKLKGKKWKQWQILFSWAPESLQMVTEAMKLKDTGFLEEKLWQT